MKRALPWNEHIDIISSDESSASDEDLKADTKPIGIPLNVNVKIELPAKENITEADVTRRAKMYQEYMKQLPIPTHRGSIIPFTTWMGLAKSIKQLYGQPLHYLTNILLKKWDQSRFGTEDEHKPLDTVIHPCKAEANIWLIEEVHRLTSSHHYLTKLWLSDPMHHAFVDPIFPQI